MNLTIEIPDEIGAALKVQAQAEGVSAARYVSRVIETIVAPSKASSNGPFETGYGVWARYGSAPSMEEVDANRCDVPEVRAGSLAIAGVAGTHAAIWFLSGDPRLSATAMDSFEKVPKLAI